MFFFSVIGAIQMRYDDDDDDAYFTVTSIDKTYSVVIILELCQQQK